MIPHSRPTIIPEDAERVAKVVSSGFLAESEETRLFERTVSEYIGLDHGCALSSGTAGLFTVLSAMGVGDGDEVIIPSYVCSSLLYAVKMTGATPRIADSGADPFHCDANSIEKVMSSKTKAVIFAHLFGNAKDIADVIMLDVPVIEDISMSIGAENKFIKAGNFGSTAAVCSFYATKVMTTGEGGMVVSNDYSLVEKVRDMIHYDGKTDSSFHFNLKTTDIASALGNAQFSRLDEMIERRREIALKYTEAFAGTDMILPEEDVGERSIFFRYVVQIPFLEDMRKSLRNRGISCERPIMTPLSKFPGIYDKCPISEEIWGKALSIPIYPSLTENETDFIISSVLKSLPH
jgi:dTDP-4-amino-4,6-dideoxygalactose transaminase